MVQEQNRWKEPGIWRVLAGAAALAAALLIGFVVGLRMGDRDRRKPAEEAVLALNPFDTLAKNGSTQDTLVVDTLVVPEAPAPKAPEADPKFSRQDIALGVEYLASHNRWNREEMERIPALKGLWDAVNTYQLDEIRQYNERLTSTPLSSVIEVLENNPKQGYYAAKGDHVITLSTYIKRLR